MSGWIEFLARGNCRAFLEASHIKGVMTPDGLGADDVATPEATLTLLTGSGESIEGIYGVSATRLLFRIAGLKVLMAHTGTRHAVVYLDNASTFDAKVADIMMGSQGDAEAG